MKKTITYYIHIDICTYMGGSISEATIGLLKKILARVLTREQFVGSTREQLCSLVEGLHGFG